VAQQGSGRAGISLVHRRLLSGGAWASGGRIAMVFTALATNALLARLLSPREVGLYFLAFSVAQLGSLMGSLGLEQAVVRFVAESVGLEQFKRARRALAWIAVLGVLGALGVGIAYSVSGQMVGGTLFHAPSLVAATGLIAGWMAVLALQKILAGAFQSFHDIRLSTVFGGLASGGMLSASLGMLWLSRGHATLTTALLLGVSSASIGLLIGGWLLHRKVTHLPAQGAKEHTKGHTIGFREIMRVAWPLTVTNLTLFVLTQAPLWILGAFRPPEEVAIYGAAARAVVLVAMPLTVANSVLPPLIAEMYPQGRTRELERALRTTATVAGIPAFLALAVFVLFGGPILGLMFGDYYREGALILALLSIAQLVNVWSGAGSIALSYTRHQAALMTLTIASGLLTILAGLAVVGPYGVNGVAVAVSAGIVGYNLALWFVTKRKTGMFTHVSVGGFSGAIRNVMRKGR
jgi:O-antigen/teichoic acid export membrane protein